MSEIKGQLLGIILVLAVFGTVMGILSSAFQHSAETIQDRVEDAAYTGTSRPVAPRANAEYSLHY